MIIQSITLSGRKIKNLRKMQGKSMVFFIKKYGISNATISKIETGKITGCNISVLYLLAKEFGVSMESLLIVKK